MHSKIHLLAGGHVAIIASVSICSGAEINMPGDRPSIQAGIDTASNGDTILFDDGPYIKRITFHGKGITIDSHFPLNFDALHIQNSLIDGDAHYLAMINSGSVIRFVENKDSKSVLIGFTVQHGYGIPLRQKVVQVQLYMVKRMELQ